VSAVDYVRALVSGLPKSERDRRQIMMLQAFVDDSGSDPQSFVYVLAGFVASPAQWAAFTDEWEKALNQSPRLAYFKNNEAMGLKGQFNKTCGWSSQKRDDRLVALAQIIRKHIPERFSVAMRHGDYKHYMHGIPVARRMKNLEHPYFMLFHEIMLCVAAIHSMSKDVSPCQFVFDQQGKIGERAAAWWPTFRQSMQIARVDFSPYFTESKPTFASDEELRPLQAADMFAGQLARAMASDKIIIPPSVSLRILMNVSGYHKIIDYQYLGRLRNDFIRMAKAIDAKEPERLKYVLGRPTRKRAKK
jgi:hypothetical protein